MRPDLAARLRAIVRQEVPSPAPAATPPSVQRELTYVPDPDPRTPDVEALAAAIGGVPLESGNGCVVIDRLIAADRSHGRWRLEACVPSAGWPLQLFDRRFVDVADAWWRKVVFFDIETTGLSGGAGTLAFLVGCGWFEAEGFRVRQFLLAAPSGEHAMLGALGRLVGDASLVVTYNGRTFDVPFMETRWAFHRRPSPMDGLAHFDMLPAARRLWSRRESARYDEGGCSLATLERAVLDVHRVGDVPGFEIPGRYFHFLRTGEAAALTGVLDHNRHDLVSLAAILAHAAWLAAEGPDACRECGEQLALGQLYQRAGDLARARTAYERASQASDREVKRRALTALAVLLRREARFEEAAEAWQHVLDLAPRHGRAWSALERQAAEALAIHHEHRRKDAAAARRYAEALNGQTGASGQRDTAHRLQRLDRKLAGLRAGLRLL